MKKLNTNKPIYVISKKTIYGVSGWYFGIDDSFLKEEYILIPRNSATELYPKHEKSTWHGSIYQDISKISQDIDDVKDHEGHVAYRKKMLLNFDERTK